MWKMTKLALSIIFAYCIVDLNHAAFVDTLSKCSINDNECQKHNYQNSLKSIHKTGVPELSIPPIDPFYFNNISVYLLNFVNLTLVDGVAKGIKNCVFSKFEIDLDKGFGNHEIVCDILIKGHFRVNAASPLIESLFGGSELRGDGSGKVKIEKLKLQLNFPIGVIKKDDGEIYFHCDYKKVSQRFDILGKVSFAAEKIYIGKNDVSDLVVGYINENWKIVMKSFGKVFIDKAIEYYNKFSRNFFDRVPARYYIIEDLTPYLKE